MAVIHKFLTFFLSILLLFLTVAPVVVHADEVSSTQPDNQVTLSSPVPSPDPSVVPSPDPSASPSPDSSVSPSPTPSPLPSADPSPAPSAAPSATPTPDVSPTPTPIPNTIQVNQTYASPTNDKVKVKFTTLPANPGSSISFNQLTLTQPQKDSIKAVSDVVFDIQSDMPNGSFDYDLTLPIPAGVSGTNFKVLYASSVDGLAGASQVSQNITNNGDGTFTIHGLNHFTIFVVVNPNSQANCDGVTVGTTPGTTCFTTIQAAVNASANGDTINVGSTGSPYNETVYVNKQLTFTGSGNPSVNAFVLQTTPVTITGITTSVSIAAPTVSLTNPVNSGNQTNTSITGTGAANATVNYTITGTSGSVSGTGVVSGAGAISITGVNVSTLPNGALTLTVNLTSGGFSSANATASAFKDTVPPAQATGLTITNPINNANQTAVAVSGSGEAGATANWTISNSGSSVSGSIVISGGGTFSVSGINVTGIPDGTLTLSVTVADVAGNTSSAATTTATKDIVAPTVNAGGNVSKNVTFTTSATATDPAPSSGIASFAWSMVSGPGVITFGTPTTLSTTVSANTDGSYVLRLTVTDAAGNSNNSTFTLTWDTQPPVISGLTNATTNTTVTRTATVTDPAPSSGGLTFQWTQTAGPGTVSFGTATSNSTTLSANMDGTYSVRFTATDSAGNSSNQTITFIWDTTNPTVSAGSNQTKNATFTQTGSASDATSGIASVTWSKISGPGTVTFGSINATTTTVSTSADGVYVIQLSATDNAGNSANSTFILTWDTTNPTVSAGSNQVKNGIFTQVGTASDSLSGIASTIWSQVSGPGTITFGSASAVSTTVSASADGAYVIKLTATDAAGNSATSTFTLTWDSVPPTVSAGSNVTKNITFTTTATASDPAPSSGIASYSWTMVSGPGTVTFGTPSALNTTVSANTDGTYIVRLTVTDNAGNSANSQFSLVWDTASPVVSAGGNITVNALFSRTGTVTDPAPSSGISTTTWSQVSGPGVVTFSSPNTLTTNISASVDGVYVIQLTATDNAGNSSNSSFTLTWDTTNPVVSAGSNQVKNALFTQTGTATDATSGVASTVWSQVSGPGTITFGTPNALTTTISANLDGVYVIRLTATDNAGNSNNSTFNLTWDSVPPTVSAGSNQIKNALFTQIGTVTDPTPSSGVASTVWSQVSGPGTITFGTPNSLSTTISASADGTYVIQLTATDNAGNTNSSTFSLTWDTTVPTVSAGSNQVKNALFTQVGTAADSLSGVASTVWSQVSGPGTITFGSANSVSTTISANVDGNYVIRLTVTDNAGNSNSSTFNLTWDTVLPNVSAGGNVTTNAQFTQTGTITDPAPSSGIASITWSKTSGPGTITFGTPNASSTTISANQDGTYVIGLSATDNAGNTSSSSFTLIWDTVSATVNVGANITTNAQFSKTATVTDPAPSSGVASTVWSQVSGPGTITFGSANSLITTISANVDGTYVIRLTATDNAGNVNSSSFTLVWDTVQPTVSAGPNVTTNTTFTQIGTVTDPAPSSGISSTVWSKVSGPGSLTFGTPNSTTTTISASADGTYVIQLTALDNAGNSSSPSFTLVWDTAQPSVNVGANITTNAQFSKTATVIDPAPSSGIATTVWSQVSGPGTISFGTPNSVTTTISASLDGVYVIRLTATDNSGNTSNQSFTLVWDTQNPTANAGSNVTTNIGFTQTGTASDSLSGVSSTTWSQVSGPGTITFGSASAVSTTISASLDGTYVIQLTATDNAGNSSNSSFTLTWDTTNPVVSAGSNQVKNALFTQTGTATDATSGVASTVWSQVSGPGTVTFGTPNALTTTISANVDGVYVIRLTAADNAGNSSNSTFTLTWDITNPTVNAGIYTPQKAIFTTTAAASDATSGIASTVWTFVSGPGVITFGTPSALNTTVSASLDGTYTIRLTVVDNAGNSNFSGAAFVWDATNPTVSAGTAPSPKNAIFTQVGSASDTTSGIVSVLWSQVSGPGTVTFGTATAATTTVSANVDGTYVIRLTATDVAGNSNNSTVTFVWDTTVPTGTWTQPLTNATVSGNVALTAAASDGSGITSVAFAYKRNDGVDIFHTIATLTASPFTTTWDTNVLALDDYTLRLVITDAAGNSINVDQTVSVATVISVPSNPSSTSTNGVTINWTTDDPTTSRIIFDTVSHPVLGAAPNYGYANSTPESDLSKVTSHSVTLSGLSAGTAYYYRIVSRGSPEAVSGELGFATLSASSGGGGGGDGGGGPSSCNDSKPEAPTLLSAVANGLNQVVLKWTKAKGSVSYYLITYGLTSGKQQYGNPNVGGPETTSYTVGGLQSGVTYYFKVRAGNGCVPGDFSNELSNKAEGKVLTDNAPAQGFIPGVLGSEKVEQVQDESSVSQPSDGGQQMQPQVYQQKSNDGLLGVILRFFLHLFGR